MSIKIMSTVWASRLPETISSKRRIAAKLVLLKLADNANDSGKCWPSIARIAHEAEMSEKTVDRALKELRESDLIHVKHKIANNLKHNTYYINIPLIEHLECKFENKSEDETDNPYLTPRDTLSHSRDTLSEARVRLPLKPSLTINEPSCNNVESVRRSCDERLTEKTEVVAMQSDRLFADQLPIEHQRCKTAMQILQELKADYPQIYDGSQTVEQWDLCELTLDWLAVSQYADNFTSFNATLRVLLESLLQLRFSASSGDSVGLPKLLCVNANDETLENIIEHEQILEV